MDRSLGIENGFSIKAWPACLRERERDVIRQGTLGDGAQGRFEHGRRVSFSDQFNGARVPGVALGQKSPAFLQKKLKPVPADQAKFLGEQRGVFLHLSKNHRALPRRIDCSQRRQITAVVKTLAAKLG